jgi:hypothetical protein
METTFDGYSIGMRVGRLSCYLWFPWRAWALPRFRTIYGLADEKVASALYFGPLDVRWFGPEAPR